jgi:signal transduction histidine kinase
VSGADSQWKSGEPGLSGDGLSDCCFELEAAAASRDPKRIALTLLRLRQAADAMRDRLASERSAREAAEASQRRAAFLAEASLMLSSSLDLHATFDHIAQLAAAVLADWCVVNIVRKDGGFVLVSAAHADPAKLSLAQELAARYPSQDWTHPLLTNVLRTGRSLFIPRITRELIAELSGQGLGAQYVDAVNTLGLGSLMTVPMLAGDRVVGAITLLTAESGRTYQAEDLALAEALARPAAMAVENARLFEEAHRERREAVALEAVARELTSSLDPGEVFQRIVDHARELCAADLALLATYDPMTREARVRAVSGVRSSALLSISFSADNGLAGRVLATGEPAAIEDWFESGLAAAAKPDASGIYKEYVAALIAEGVAAKAIVPVRYRGAVTGVLWAAQRSRRRFSGSDLKILGKLADHVAIALEHTRLYAQAEQLAVNRERVRVANELHDTLSQLLFSMALKLDWCLHKLAERSKIRDKLNEIRREAGLTMTQIRRLISELSQEEGPARTLGEKLGALVDAFRELTGLTVRFTLRADLDALEEPEQRVLYRVVQEALANVAKHARAGSAEVRLVQNGAEMDFEITDDGVGPPPHTDVLNRPGHFGLRQMTERLEALGGRLAASPATPNGFRLAGALPLKKEGPHGQDSDRRS